jgi:hypothetical protein
VNKRFVWSSEWVRPLRQVPYPSSPEAVLKAISLVEREDIKNYFRPDGEERWDDQKIDLKILKAVSGRDLAPIKLIVCPNTGKSGLKMSEQLWANFIRSPHF